MPNSRDVRSRDALPKGHAIHWVAKRKAQVVQAVRRGVLSLDEACRRYMLSFEEFLEWQRAFSADGVNGLKARRSRGRTRRTSQTSA